MADMSDDEAIIIEAFSQNTPENIQDLLLSTELN